MKRQRHAPEQVVRKLRAGEEMLAKGKDLAAVLVSVPDRGGVSSFRAKR